MDGLSHERTLCAKYCASADALFYYFLVDFPSRGIGKIKREFRALRSAA